MRRRLASFSVNREAVIRAAYFMCKALGQRASRREVDAIIAKQTGGKTFRHAEVDRVLTSLRGPIGVQPGTTTGTKDGAQELQLGTTTGTGTGPYARVVTRTSNSSSESTTPHNPKQKRLRLVPAGEGEAQAILDAVFPLVSERIAGKLTKTKWRQINKRAALDMAQAGLTTPQVIAAHSALCEAWGDTVYMLDKVHKRIVAGGGKAARGRDCPGCELTPAECERHHNDPNDIYQNYYELEA